MSADQIPRQPTAAAGSSRTLRCDEARILLMGHIDDELGPAETKRIEDHLAVCVSCRREETAFRALGEVTEEMINEELPAIDLDAEWHSIYRRMERSLGWLLMSVGLIILFGFGAWQLVSEFLLNGEASGWLRVGVGAALAGMIVLLVSISRESLTKYRSERYREVQR